MWYNNITRHKDVPCYIALYVTFIYECTIVYSTCYATYALYHTCFSYADSIVIITWYVWKRYIAAPKMPDVMLGTATVGTVGLIARLNWVSSTGWPGPAWPETIQRAFRALRRLLGIRDSESERRARFQLLKMPVQVVSTRTRGTDWSLWHRWWLAFKVALWLRQWAAWRRHSVIRWQWQLSSGTWPRTVAIQVSAVCLWMWCHI